MHSLSRCMQFSFILPTKLTDTQGSWIVVCIYSGIAQKEEFVLCFGIKVSVSLREAMFTFWVRCLCCRTPVVYTFHVHIPVFQFNNSFSVVHPTSCKILRLLFWMFLFSVHTIRRRTLSYCSGEAAIHALMKWDFSNRREQSMAPSLSQSSCNS